MNKKTIVFVGFSWIFIIFVVFLIANAPFHFLALEKKQKSIPGNAALNLTPKQRTDLSEMAIAGDSDAAWRLSIYYEAYAFDWPDAIYWKQISAENGDPRHQYSFGVFLTDYSEGPQSEGVPRDLARRRGKYWICKAAQKGLPYAQSKIREIEKQDGLIEHCVF